MLTPVLLFFDISAGELIIILLVAFVVFGPSRIPEIARKIGRGLNEVRRASDEIKREITKETRKFENTMAMDDLDLSETRRPVKKKENTDIPSDQDEKKIIEPEKNNDEGQPLA
jgi:TatA/E family protein of Tat protein translocase